MKVIKIITIITIIMRVIIKLTIGGLGHGSRHRVLCANFSDLSDMAYVLDVC